ncbi:MAG: EamA family transporter, partial [Clostridiaceae bacterium]
YLIALSATAFTIWTYLMRDHEAASVSIYFFLLPVFGVLLSGLFLGEQILSLRNLAALLFVCAGIYVVNSRPRVKITTPAA